MSREQTAGPLVVQAPAKINLTLEVLGKRPDGYHEVRSVMQAVSLCDELRLAPLGSGQVRVRCEHPLVPADEGNLVVRAARLMQQRAGAERGVDVTLVKRVPVGGGFGGGSSDGAATLLALNRMWETGLDVEELRALAAQLGSDVPFFITGGTALCEGRGERVTPMQRAGVMHYVVLMPPLSISTAAVYGAYRAPLTMGEGASKNVVDALEAADVGRLLRWLRNDLQAPALALCPELGTLWSRLEEAGRACGVERVLLSGSGAGLFAPVRTEADARRAAVALEDALSIPCTPVHSLPAWNGSLPCSAPWR